MLRSPGARIGFAAFFLMGSDPARYPVYRAEAINGAERLPGWPGVPTDASLGQQYEHHIQFVAAFSDRLREAGLEVRDALDAQSLIWILMKGDEEQFRDWRATRDHRDPPAGPLCFWAKATQARPGGISGAADLNLSGHGA